MCLFSGLGEEGLSLLTIFLLLIPAALYVMGLMEGKKGYYFFLSGVFFHILSILQRGLVIGGIPLTEKHDNISFMAFSMALAYWYFYRKGVKDIGITALPLISVFMCIALAFKPIDTVSPFLRSPWFYVHIFFYFIGYGFFGISACIGLHYIINGKGEYEMLQYKGSIHGWIIFTIALVAGSIWFFMAYGTYWLWTSKELWITLVWFYYGLYLHARLIKGLSGRPAAALGCVGFALALFAYFGVGAIIPSPPTQF
jgi:ABC-type uncharacterized transport system permease subunit